MRGIIKKERKTLTDIFDLDKLKSSHLMKAKSPATRKIEIKKVPIKLFMLKENETESIKIVKKTNRKAE